VLRTSCTRGDIRAKYQAHRRPAEIIIRASVLRTDASSTRLRASVDVTDARSLARRHTEKPVTFDTYKKTDDLMNPPGGILARRCRRSASGARIRRCAWFGFLCSRVSAKCIWPLQGENRLRPRLLVAGLAIVPDDKLTIARGTSKAEARPVTAQDVKSILKPAATRAPRSKDREELQSPVERVHQGKVHE